MTFINYAAREINCKIVYYGPGLCGKTTNLQYIYAKTSPDAKGKMISLATETERTLFFDFLPLSLGEIRGFKTRFHLYTVPGQVFYDASRKLILKGVDGVVFVADSQEMRMEANIESLQNLDTTSLASLTAGNVAAMGGLAKLIGEKEFPNQFHEGEKESLHMSIVGGRVVLVVIFDAKSSLGLVRLRVKKAGEELGRVFDTLAKKQATPGAQSPFAEITDDDIDNLFSE